MNKTVLITGANGRLGQASIKAFAERGWAIHTLTRDGSHQGEAQDLIPTNTALTSFNGDVCDYEAFLNAATGCSAILHAANPSYEHWAHVLPKSIQTLINVAKTINATILMPGNVYTYGESMPPLLTLSTPHAPSCELGELRADLEQALKEAADKDSVQTLLLRAGGYIDGRDTGNWFESYMCKDLDKGKFMYPGSDDAPCAWVYLEDVAKAFVKVAEKRNQLAAFEDIGVPGFSVSGDQFHKAMEKTLGKPLKRVGVPWLFLKFMGIFQPNMKGVYALRYLFYVPHAIDGSRLLETVPDWKSTSLNETLEKVFKSKPGPYNVK